jgi:hypothetical protein
MTPSSLSLKKIALSMILAAVFAYTAVRLDAGSDRYVRHRAVMLEGAHGSCSGVQVRTPKGKDVILSAGHCADLADEGQILVTPEGGTSMWRKVLKESDEADVLVLEGVPSLPGLPIAAKFYDQEHIRTFTHGLGMKTYKTEGVIIQDQMINVPAFPISDADSMLKCLFTPKYAINIFSEEMAVCMLVEHVLVTNAWVLPGSSGGMAVNSSGEVVGVVSAGDLSHLSFLVPSADLLAAVR